MERIILHWSAGAHTASTLDLAHYHFVIDGQGRVHKGKHPVSANAGPLRAGAYAAHTLNANTGSIGVALAAMAGAQERPFRAGKYPITPAQVDALAALCADLCRQYDIPVSRQTVLSHAEVQPTLGITQRGKWDVTWLPGMSEPGAPVAVGDMIRARIVAELAPKPGAQPTPAPPNPGAALTTEPLTLESLAAEVAALKADVAALKGSLTWNRTS